MSTYMLLAKASVEILRSFSRKTEICLVNFILFTSQSPWPVEIENLLAKTEYSLVDYR